jgi:hypothetical protein
MSTKADEREEPEEEAAEEEAPATFEQLVAREDVEGLLALAKACRAGTGGVAKDLPKCLECYRAAAKLGNAEAEYGAALFYLSGGVVPQDLKEGALRLRVAADNGYLPAKVYLANLYELGVHYAEDTAKADVWYRSAARAAEIEDEPGSDAYARAMAELGCARYALALSSDTALTAEQREHFLKKAKAYGYLLKMRRERDSQIAEQKAAVLEEPAATRAAGEAEPAPKPRPARAAPGARPSTPRSHALLAFLFETLFVGASVGAGYLAHLGAIELLQRGSPVPIVGHRLELIIPAFLAVLGVLPAFLTYRAGTVVRAIAVGAIAGGAGYALWETGRGLFMATLGMQCLVFGVGGFLATLFVLGLTGGAKPPRRPIPRILA